MPNRLIFDEIYDSWILSLLLFTLDTTIEIIHFWGTKGSSLSTFKDRYTLIEQSGTLIEQSVTYRAKQYILRWLYLDKTQNLYHDAHKS